jgi:hypothetical protein
LVHPTFHAGSFWNYKAACELVGARYPSPPLGLITVAAMLPPHWQLRLIDRNCEPLCDDDIDEADLVMTGGMLPQQSDILRLIDRCHSRGKPVVIGGPDVTHSPQLYSQADFQVLGEAEPVIGQFIEAWTSGAERGVFQAEKFSADVTQTPIPRFDLLNFRNYLFINLQFSRGCPFNCEFCDIIELYGRKPRTKTNAQMLAEIEALHALGYRGHIDFVDDNLIGNKKAVKQFLPHLIEWQQVHGYPFEFSTEASINLADDDQLLELMRGANFFGVFIGIESPDTDTLIAMQKKQNTRRSLAASINRIYGYGIIVVAGFIIGFDTERGNVADAMIACVEDTSIPVCMVGLLFALTNTQLTRRLLREGRLHAGFEFVGDRIEGDQCTAGLNFETKRPRRDVLADYTAVLAAIYEPKAYFARVRRVAATLDRSTNRTPRSMLAKALDTALVGMFVGRMIQRQPGLTPHLVRTWASCARTNPDALKYVARLMAVYLHLGPYSRQVIGQLERHIAALDRGDWIAPPLAPAISTVEERRPARRAAAG